MARVAKYALRVGAIDETQTGSREGRSVQDALIALFTPAQEWLSQRETYQKPGSQPTLRQTILANDIEGAFNTVHHERLINVMTLYGFPAYIVNWTRDFCTNRTLGFHFQGETETPQSFDSGLPQGSPLPPVLFVVYSAPTITTFTSRTKVNSIHVDDDTILQGSSSEQKVTTRLQPPLNDRVVRAAPLGHQYSANKSDLIHLYATIASRLPIRPAQSSLETWLFQALQQSASLA